MLFSYAGGGTKCVETGILLIEKVGTVNTGDREGDKMTSYVDEKI